MINEKLNQIPTNLYKYMWFNPEVIRISPNYYKDLFVKKQIYFPTVVELNDPYDCYPTFSLEGCDDDQLRTLLKDRCKDKYSDDDYKLE